MLLADFLYQFILENPTCCINEIPPLIIDEFVGKYPDVDKGCIFRTCNLNRDREYNVRFSDGTASAFLYEPYKEEWINDPSVHWWGDYTIINFSELWQTYKDSLEEVNVEFDPDAIKNLF